MEEKKRKRKAMTIRLVMDLEDESRMSYPPVNDSKLMRDNLLQLDF